jgi:ATP-binding cassette, subfamily C (CFTR/MRP), member 1
VSTLARIIDPKPGTLSVDGQDITTIRRSTAREHIICLPQEALVFPRSFMFNIDPEGRGLDPAISGEILRSVGMWQLVESRGGLDSEVEPHSLSQGEKQLLALARALVRRHALDGRCILVLDEATSSLDDDTQARFQAVIDKEFKENTVISVAHRLEVLRNVDMIFVLDNGRIAKQATPAEVLVDVNADDIVP